MTYEDFLPAEDVATFKRVKKASMVFARVCRQALADVLGGTIGDKHGSAKEFVCTNRATFRVCMSHDSDNSTERRAHYLMGVRTFVMGDEAQMEKLFLMHGIDPTVGQSQWLGRVAKELWGS